MSVRDLTNDDLLDWISLQSTLRLIEEGEAELRRRLQAGEQAVNELNRLADGIAALEWASIDPASETVVDSALGLLQSGEEAERERDRLAEQVEKLEVQLAAEREHVDGLAEGIANISRTPGRVRAEAAERERDRLAEALQRLGSMETLTIALDLAHSRDSAVADELRARIEFARKALGEAQDA